MKITLPPPPETPHIKYMERRVQNAYTADQMRARDLEVARVVLEAAANVAHPARFGSEFVSDTIRNLEFKHDK